MTHIMGSNLTMKQLTLFDLGLYEKPFPSHYDLEDGYFHGFPVFEVVSESSPSIDVSESEDEVVIESLQDDFVSESEDEIVIDSLQDDSLTTNFCGVIGKYRAGGNTRGDSYYWRFSYRDGFRVRHCHIPGGNTSNPIAASRAEEVRRAIVSGRSVAEVLELIRSLKSQHKP